MGYSYHMSVLFLGFRLLPKLHAAATWLHAPELHLMASSCKKRE